MGLLLLGIIFFVLVIMFIQDIKFRAISWYLFPLLALALGIFAYTKNYNAWMVLEYSAYNIGFLIIQLGLITLYFTLKHKKLINITKELLGLGDILFFICLAFLFSPLNYMFFYLTSLILVIALAALLFKNTSSVPLAGLQALILIPVLLINECQQPFQVWKDDFLMNLLVL